MRLSRLVGSVFCGLQAAWVFVPPFSCAQQTPINDAVAAQYFREA